MEIGSSAVAGVFFWRSNTSHDCRGSFSKVIPSESKSALGSFELRDAFITESHAGVIRGMHLQVDAFASARIVHILEGEINDVIIDLRKTSQSFREVHSLNLSSEGINTLLIPSNIAHGFESVTKAKILYLSNKEHNPNFDTGFNPLTIGFNWMSEKPTISDRDLNLPNFARRE